MQSASAFISRAAWLLLLRAALASQVDHLNLVHGARTVHADHLQRDLLTSPVQRDHATVSFTGSSARYVRESFSHLSATHRVFNAGADEIRVDFKHKQAAHTTIATNASAQASPSAVRPLEERRLAYMSYGVAICIAAVGIFYMFKERGVCTCIAIICNVLALSIMSLLIRNVFVNSAFPYAQFVTASHAFITFLVGVAVLIYRGKPRWPDLRTWRLGIAPVGCATALNLGLANLGLLFTNAHFYEMLGASGFLVTAFVGLMMGRRFSYELYPPMLLVTVGTAVLSLGEIHFSMIGAALIIGATFCRAGKAQIQSLLMSADSTMMQLDPVELVTCTSLLTFVIMTTWSMMTEGSKPWLQVLTPTVLASVLIAAANAAVLNIASIFVIRSVGPVAQQCIGQLKGVLCCIGSVAAFGEKITTQQMIGYSIVICGIFWYNQRDMNLKPMRLARELTK